MEGAQASSKFGSGSNTGAPAADEYEPLAPGKPFFDITLTHSSLKYPQLDLPACAVRLFPNKPVEVKLQANGENWTTQYSGDPKRPKFDIRWKKFVVENALEEGDALVFQRMDCTSELVVFKIMILRDRLPPELEKKIASRAKAADKPVLLD